MTVERALDVVEEELGEYLETSQIKGEKVKYYLKDSFLHNAHEKNAGSKARNDVEAILISEGYEA